MRQPTPISNDVTPDQLRICNGTIVDVERDTGRVETRVALSSPAMLCGTLCVKVEGLGAFALSRVTPSAYQAERCPDGDLRIVLDGRTGSRSLCYTVVHAPSGMKLPGEWTWDVARQIAIDASAAAREGGGR